MTEQSALLKPERATLQAIAATVEGAEIKALQGAERTVQTENALASQEQETLKSSAIAPTLDLAVYNPDIISHEKLVQAVTKFEYTKGAMTKDGPL